MSHVHHRPRIARALERDLGDHAARSRRTILVAAIASDGAVGPDEAARLNWMVPSLRLYRQTPPEHLQHLIEGATARVAGSESGPLLASCAGLIPEELRTPLFALAIELVFADGRVADREKSFVDALQTALAIDDDTAIKIVEVLLLKSRV